ncbi:MAG: hypothetical protein H0X13_15500 [Ramlibacter sp.]|nr:hypothetical protein [Ramlibacter sp.]
MPVPTLITELSPIAANNYPAGTNAPSTLDDVQRAHGSFIAQLRDLVHPIGSIIMYDGLTSELPANWKVCDGTNGTPDLRDKFIIGAAVLYPLNTTGGSKDAIVVGHAHSVSISANTGTESGDHTHAVNDQGHTHVTNIPIKPNGFGGGPYAMLDGGNPLGGTQATASNSAATGINLSGRTSAHTHALGWSGSTASAGSSGLNANLPPYQALHFIKRIS